MTQLDLDAIKARLAAATPGPWELDSAAHTSGDSFWVVYGIASVCPAVVDITPNGAELYTEGLSREDAVLAAHAPTDIAALIAEVESLWEDNRRIHAHTINALRGNGELRHALETHLACPNCTHCEDHTIKEPANE